MEFLPQQIVNPEQVFARYRPIIDDWEAFLASLRRPLPLSIWANPLRVTPGRLETILHREGVDLEPIPWYPGAFRLLGDVRPGRLWPFLAGLFQVQEEVAMLPVLALDPRPGERILDLCAAPGNKTAQIALLLRNSGTVVANDKNYGRMRALRQTLDRLGLTNVTTTTYDGARYPNKAGSFDRVLVDAPCSCEGTTRKSPEVLEIVSPEFCVRNAELQRALLRRALRLCRPGGTIVYSTCTYAPEENEAVVQAMLDEAGEMLRILSPKLPPIRYSPGLTEWQGQRFSPDMQRCVRIWPHQNDSGGFFIAVLQKSPDVPLPEDNHAGLSTEEILNQIGTVEPKERWLPPLQERFGISEEAFSPYLLLRRTREKIFLVSRDHRPPFLPRPTTVGLPFLRINMKVPKMTTQAAMLLGRFATRNVVSLTPEQRSRYHRREVIELEPEQRKQIEGRGYVLLNFEEFTLGMGFYRGNGVVESLFPRAWSPDHDKID